jgi:hypothetical protein
LHTARSPPRTLPSTPLQMSPHQTRHMRDLFREPHTAHTSHHLPPHILYGLYPTPLLQLLLQTFQILPRASTSSCLMYLSTAFRNRHGAHEPLGQLSSLSHAIHASRLRIQQMVFIRVRS